MLQHSSVRSGIPRCRRGDPSLDHGGGLFGAQLAPQCQPTHLGVDPRGCPDAIRVGHVVLPPDGIPSGFVIVERRGGSRGPDVRSRPQAPSCRDGGAGNPRFLSGGGGVPDTLALLGSPLAAPPSGAGSTYLFRRDDEWIVDATRRGSAARYINHSCAPNVCSRIVTVGGERRIIIVALRAMAVGEELTYDYKFAKAVGDEDRLVCYCGAACCTGFMN